MILNESSQKQKKDKLYESTLSKVQEQASMIHGDRGKIQNLLQGAGGEEERSTGKKYVKSFWGLEVFCILVK